MAHLKGLSYPSAGRDIKAYPHILFLAALCGMQDFSFPTRDQICAPAMGVPKFNHRTSRESSVQFSSVQLLSRVRLFLTPWITAPQASLSITNSRGLLKTHARRVSDVMQPPSPLSSPSPPAPNPFPNHGLLQWVNSSHEVAKVLEFQLQHQSFQWTPRTDFL